jgi:tRNA pseudouridine38-40 synthase
VSLFDPPVDAVPEGGGAAGGVSTDPGEASAQAGAPAPGGRRIRLQVAYDGRRFHGFAPQAVGVRTVANVLAGALDRILRLPAPPELVCAGRTDAGVHAWDQRVHLDVPDLLDQGQRDRAADLAGLQRRLNKLLGPEVVVRSASVAPPGWDARHSALARSYRYHVLTTPVPDPFRAGFVWWVPGGLDRRAMELAGDALVGEHHFGSFCRKPSVREGSPVPSLVRRVESSAWSEPSPGLLRFEITANAFCHQMVRSIVGTLVEVGSGRRRAGEMLGIVRSDDRARAGTVAPPDGLTLWHVRYPPE